MTSCELEITASARAAIDALPPKDRSVIMDAVRIIHALPYREGTRLKDELAGYRRVKKGRHRIFYAVDEERSLIIILHIGFRKAGDRHDAYREFQRLFVRRRP